MADFVAVLKKTLDGLSETTPQTREKVYEKARLTIAGKLSAMNPPPPASVIDRQKRALEDAIAEIEREFAPAKPAVMDPLTELENVFASLKSSDPLAVLRQPAAPPPVAARPVIAPPMPVAPPPPVEPVQLAPPVQPVPVEPPRPAPLPELDFNGEAELDFDDDPAEAQTIAADNSSPRRERRYGGLIMAAVVAVVAIGGGYGIWVNRSAFGDMLGLGGTQTAANPEVPAEPVAPPEAAVEPPAEVAAAPAAPQEPAAAEPAETPPPAEDEAKFTQRLNPDGTEVDPGPAGGEPGIGEGTSVAAVTQGTTPTDPVIAATDVPATGETPPAETPAPSDVAAGTDPAAPAPPPPAGAEQAIPVGQRAIFYEERTNVAEASAEPGSIVWTVVQESPGGDLPPEPAIRAEATIPGKDVQLRMTIRRNADQTLPASHIVEVIFLTPEGFEGGGIDNVLRISMKGSEQEAGSPLIGIPAKIADGFFLIALNDSKPEIDANMTLLRRQSWIDVPVQYKSGRRALFTMEKGIPGTKVFDEALRAWQAATTASTPG